MTDSNPPAAQDPSSATPAKNSDEEEKEEDVSPLYEGESQDDWNPLLRTSMLRVGQSKDPDRRDHMQQMIRQKRASMHYVKQALYEDDSTKKVSETPASLMDVLTDSKMKELQQDTVGLKNAAEIAKTLQGYYPADENRVGVRLKNFSYEVNVDPNSNKIQTVFNQSCFYYAIQFWKIMIGKEKRPEKERKFVLQNVNLNFQPGKMYLILGPPLSGKTTLLKAIAGRLSTEHGETIEGTVEYNGLSMEV